MLYCCIDVVHLFFFLLYDLDCCRILSLRFEDHFISFFIFSSRFNKLDYLQPLFVLRFYGPANP